MLRKYETLLLMSPELGSENRQEILDNLTRILTSDSGKILLVDDWGVRNLAYPVQKFTRGHYTRLEYVTEGRNIAELERIIRITEGIFKFVTVKLADKVAPEEN